MAALHALLIGGGLLVLAAIIMSYRRTATPKRLVAIALLAFAATPGWLLFPTHQLDVTSFGTNAIVHLGIFSLVGAMLPRPRRPPTPKMRTTMIVFRIVLGILFLILGVIGGFIPILQGWIFILLGLLVLFPKAKFTEKVLHKAEPKMPRVVRFLRRLGIGTEAEG